jgi:hypothetical protein
MSRVVFALLFWSILPSLVEAQSMQEAAAQLAAHISSLLQRRATVSLDFQNLTALPPAESSSFRSALETELRSLGLAVVTTQPDVKLRITISANVHGPMFVAEVLTGDTKQVVMMPWSAMPAAAEQTRQLQLTRKVIWEQPEPMLDFILVDAGSQMLMLTASRVLLSRLVDGKWVVSGQAALTLARPLPRDPRGRIQITADAFRIYVPGTTCLGVLQTALKLTCSAGNETWLASREPELPVRWVTDRNFLESDGIRATFFSAAGGLLAGTGAWGSDVAGVQNPCGSNALVVAAKSGEALEQDQLQVFEIERGLATAVSDPLDVPGPVTALWPSDTRGQAALVIRNSKTGNYEASVLGIACTQ